MDPFFTRTHVRSPYGGAPIMPGGNSPSRSEERLTWGEHDHTCISEVIAAPLRSGNNLWVSAPDDNSGQQKGTS
jgi:hypothetical protein